MTPLLHFCIILFTFMFGYNIGLIFIGIILLHTLCCSRMELTLRQYSTKWRFSISVVSFTNYVGNLSLQFLYLTMFQTLHSAHLQVNNYLKCYTRPKYEAAIYKLRLVNKALAQLRRIWSYIGLWLQQANKSRMLTANLK